MTSSSDALLDHIADYMQFISNAQLFWFMLNTTKIQVRLRYVLRKDPTISYVEYLTNLSNESWTRAHGRYLEADLL